MPIKTCLDYDGLSYYDEKWRLTFAQLGLTNSEIDRLYANAIDNANTWSITINTSSTGQIPFCLYDCDNASMTVDWGDGTVETYTSDNAEEDTCIEHSYSSRGTYTITMVSDDFPRLYIYSMHDWTAGDYQYTLRRVNSPLPTLAGIRDEEEIDDNSFCGLFYESDSLSYIPDGLFKNNPLATDFSYCFYKCLSLASIPEDTFAANTLATNFSRCFDGCESITSIPEKLFQNNTLATNFEACFNGCIELLSIPGDLFKNNTLATNFYACFSVCELVAALPENLFKHNTNATEFTSCFSQCDSITTIPEKLFEFTTSATSFNSLFYGCDNLQTIPFRLFENATSVATFERCFERCPSLQDFQIKIGSKAATKCSYMFANGSNPSGTICVPPDSTTYDTFISYYGTSDRISILTTADDSTCTAPFEYTVNAAEKKTGIPFNLYSQYGVTLTVDWGDGTTSILTPADYTELNSRASVHEYALAGIYNVCINSSDWSSTYILSYPQWDDRYAVTSDEYDCVAPLYWWRKTLTEINYALPNFAGLNVYNTPLEYIDEDTSDILWQYSQWFSGLFSGCSNLSWITPELFQNNTEKTYVSCDYTFYGCSSLVLIPDTLFENIMVHQASGCFANCTRLAAVPPNLLSHATTLFSVEKMFYGCSWLGDFSFRIISTNCRNANNFVTLKSGKTRVIYVPSGSTTQTTFNGVASTLGLTIVGE